MASPEPQVYLLGPNGVAYLYKYAGASPSYTNSDYATGSTRALLIVIVVILIVVLIFLIFVWGPSWWRRAHRMAVTRNPSTESKPPDTKKRDDE